VACLGTEFQTTSMLAICGCIASIALLAWSGHSVVAHTSVDEVVLGVYAVGAAHGGADTHCPAIPLHAALSALPLSLSVPPLAPTVIGSFLLRQLLLAVQTVWVSREPSKPPANVSVSAPCATPRTLLRGLAEPEESVALGVPVTTEVFSIDEFETMKKEKEQQRTSPSRSSRASRRSARTPTRYGEWDD
jgi:hypothetical protein